MLHGPRITFSYQDHATNQYLTLIFSHKKKVIPALQKYDHPEI